MITEILSGIWIGNLEELNNIQFLNDTKISIIINCTLNHQVSSNYNCQRIRVPVSELNDESLHLLKHNLTKIIDFIHTNIDEKNILIIGYNNYTIPIIIISSYMMKNGDIKKEIIMDILRSKNKQFQLDSDLSHFL